MKTSLAGIVGVVALAFSSVLLSAAEPAIRIETDKGTISPEKVTYDNGGFVVTTKGGTVPLKSDQVRKMVADTSAQMELQTQLDAAKAENESLKKQVEELKKNRPNMGALVENLDPKSKIAALEQEKATQGKELARLNSELNVEKEKSTSLTQTVEILSQKVEELKAITPAPTPAAASLANTTGTAATSGTLATSATLATIKVVQKGWRASTVKGFTTVTGEITNTGAESYSLAGLDITLRDSAGNVLGSAAAFVTDLAAGQKKSFSTDIEAGSVPQNAALEVTVGSVEKGAACVVEKK